MRLQVPPRCSTISRERHGNLWNSMDITGYQWKSTDIMEIHGTLQLFMDIDRNQWISIDICGNPCISTHIHGFPGHFRSDLFYLATGRAARHAPRRVRRAARSRRRRSASLRRPRAPRWAFAPSMLEFIDGLCCVHALSLIRELFSLSSLAAG